MGFTLIRDNKSVTYDSFEELKTLVKDNEWKDCSIKEEIKDNQDGKTKETYDKERIHTFTIEFGQDEEDHDYTISIITTDLAGNSNSSVTDKNIGAETVATGKEFTVDMVAPTLDVKYITYQDENGQEDKDGIDITKEIVNATDEDSRFIKTLQFLLK